MLAQAALHGDSVDGGWAVMLSESMAAVMVVVVEFVVEVVVLLGVGACK